MERSASASGHLTHQLAPVALKTVKPSLDSVVLAISLGLLGSRALPAQLSLHLSADAAVANSSITGGEYLAAERGKLVLAGGAYVDLRLWSTPFRLVGGATGERYYNGDKVNLICVPGSHGQCLNRVPNLDGLIGLLGLRYEPLARVSALAAFGRGDVQSPSEDGNAATSARAHEVRLEADARVITHLALGARLQYVTVPNYTGIRLSVHPVSLVISLR